MPSDFRGAPTIISLGFTFGSSQNGKYSRVKLKLLMWDSNRLVARDILYTIYSKFWEDTYSEEGFGPPPLVDSEEEEEELRREKPLVKTQRPLAKRLW